MIAVPAIRISGEILVEADEQSYQHEYQYYENNGLAHVQIPPMSAVSGADLSNEFRRALLGEHPARCLKVTGCACTFIKC